MRLENILDSPVLGRFENTYYVCSKQVMLRSKNRVFYIYTTLATYFDIIVVVF